MDWDIDFITYEHFKEHVQNTIDHYGEKLESYDVKKFNKNIIDPIKMIFDKAVYGNDWQTLISNEISDSATRRTTTRSATSISGSSIT